MAHPNPETHRNGDTNDTKPKAGWRRWWPIRDGLWVDDLLSDAHIIFFRLPPLIFSGVLLVIPIDIGIYGVIATASVIGMLIWSFAGTRLPVKHPDVLLATAIIPASACIYALGLAHPEFEQQLGIDWVAFAEGSRILTFLHSVLLGH
jgi:hypothetical protein